MKKFLFLVLTQMILLSSYAQSILFVHDTISLSQSSAYGSTIDMINRFTNTSGVTVTYQWKMVSLAAPATWGFSICDIIACRAEGIDTGNFNLAAGAESVMAYNMVHHGVPGNGIGALKVTNQADSTDTHTVYFLGSMYLNTGIYEQMSEASLNVFPNPAIDQISFNTAQPIENGSFNILSMNGDVVFTKEINGINKESFNIRSLQAGNYIVVLKDEKNKTMLTRSIIKN